MARRTAITDLITNETRDAVCDAHLLTILDAIHRGNTWTAAFYATEACRYAVKAEASRILAYRTSRKITREIAYQMAHIEIFGVEPDEIESLQEAA